jgi:hypothetical protein
VYAYARLPSTIDKLAIGYVPRAGDTPTAMTGDVEYWHKVVQFSHYRPHDMLYR